MAHVLDKVARVPAVCVCVFFFKNDGHGVVGT